MLGYASHFVCPRRYLPLREDKKMKVKIFSVRFYGDYGVWKPSIVSEVGVYEKLKKEKGQSPSVDEYLERAIQSFLDEHPKIGIKHVQYATTPIYFGEPGAGPKWEIEKSALIFYDEQD
jgi:hypothetical protein